MSQKLSHKHITDICKMGQGSEACSFLIAGPEGLECSKGTSIEATIRERRSKGQIGAMGDNCSGPPLFQNSKWN